MPGKSELARIARITAKIAVTFIAFVLLLGLVWAVINSFDVPLTDQAKALLAVPPNPCPADQNIYLAMAGLEGPSERPIIEMGQERIEAYNQALDSMLLNPAGALELNKKWDAAKLTFVGTLELGASRSNSIWTNVKSHRQEIATLLGSNQRLYQRYLSLQRMKEYYETVRPSFMAPVIYAPQPVRMLFLADVANRVQTAASLQQRDALNDLKQDLQMWRTVLKGDGTLVGKMLAVASLHADLILIADLISDPSTDLSSLSDTLDPILVPFDLKDYRIGNAFAAEFRGTAALYKSITFANEYTLSPAPPWQQRTWNAVQAHFFKVNATENMGAAMAEQWVALANSDAGQFYLHRDAYHEWLDQNEPRLSPAFLYNPIGKILVKLAVSKVDAYPMRIYDVAAYQRLVYTVFQLKRQHIATSGVAAFLKAHPEWSTHPVDGKPFLWDADTGELAVKTLGEHPKEQRFSSFFGAPLPVSVPSRGTASQAREFDSPSGN